MYVDLKTAVGNRDITVTTQRVPDLLHANSSNGPRN